MRIEKIASTDDQTVVGFHLQVSTGRKAWAVPIGRTGGGQIDKSGGIFKELFQAWQLRSRLDSRRRFMAVPEPSSFVLAAIAGAAFGWHAWRKR